MSSRVVVNTDDPLGKTDQLIGDFIDNSGAVSRFPFFTDRSLRRLFYFLDKKNPKCEIEFNIGLRKINGQDLFIKKALNILNQGQPLFIIGSSLFDRNRIKELIKLCQQIDVKLLNYLYYLDTGKMIY